MHKINSKYVGISYRDLRKDVEAFAAGLDCMGVHAQDRVAIISENRPEWVIADMAIMVLGAINVSIYPTLTAKQFEYILRDAGCSCVIVSNVLQLKKILSVLPEVPSLKKIVLLSGNELDGISNVYAYKQIYDLGRQRLLEESNFLQKKRKNIAPGNLIALIYTSGTTGNPKGVMLTHANLVSNICACADCIPFTADDRLLSFLPLCHSYERMAGYYTALACGATIAYAESMETVRENLLEVQPTIVTTVPRLFERMYNKIQKQINGGGLIRKKFFWWAIEIGKRYRRGKRTGAVTLSLKFQHKVAHMLVLKNIKAMMGGRINFFASGGAALTTALGEFFEAADIRIIEGYGMTESSPVISVNRVDNYKFGTVGKPIPGVEVMIAKDREILVRGPNIMQGYWNNEQATREAITEAGWLRTGDIGKIDEDGFLVITDRKKHLFVSSGGKNIAPQHIEDILLRSNLIDQCVLIGDGKMFLTALIVPDFDALKIVADAAAVSYSSHKELVENEVLRLHVEKEITSLQQDLASFERVRKFVLLDHSLSIEDGELTPTLKVKRKAIEEKYKDIIEKMYAGIG